MAQISIVLDTNVLLSGIAYPNSVPGKIITVWRDGGIDVILSHYILNELQCVLPKLNHRLASKVNYIVTGDKDLLALSN